MVKGVFISESKHTHGADLNVKRKARMLRKNMTDSERLLWNQLRNKKLNGMYFRRQHPYGIYILDFFCAKTKLVIEIDGEIHNVRKEYDNERTDYLNNTGLKIIRFSNSEIERNMEDVINRIKEYL